MTQVLLPGSLGVNQMPKTLSTLQEAYALAAKQHRIADLKAEAAYAKMEEALVAFQEACPHKDIEETSSYHNGGYDYVAETHYSRTCSTCHKVLNEWVQIHPGIYG